MAVTTQILNDGPRNHVVHIDIDGATASAATVVDASAWSQAAEYSECKVVRAQWSTETDVQLFWDATADVQFLELTSEGDQCYQDTGGIINNAGAGKTGNIVIINGAGDGHVTLWCQKRA